MRKLALVSDGRSDVPQDESSSPRSWRHQISRPFNAIGQELPHIGTAGSRSAHLHISVDSQADPSSPIDSALTSTSKPQARNKPLSSFEFRRFAALRLIGTIGSLLISFGALGAGAFPVINNPYVSFPGGNFMARMLQTSSMIVLIGIGLLVLAWVLMAPFTGISIHRRDTVQSRISLSMLRRTFAAWVAPIMLTAPVFTQDIYSYLAQGSIVAQGLDPYSGGPIELLGSDDHLARSVPFIWAQSPSPYGPVALGIASSISTLTNDSIVAGVFAHRIISLLGVIAAGWAITMLARRCQVSVEAAFWLGVLNPLLILHLIGGIHNESILLGLMLVGLEVALRGIDRLSRTTPSLSIFYIFCGGFLISCAGMVKVTGFIALGFVGMALAKKLRSANHSHLRALGIAFFTQIAIFALSIAAVTIVTGIGLGWVTGQGGAASIRSWMSMSTNIGVIFGFINMNLGLGDHTEAMLSVSRTIGLLLAAIFMIRMLFATYRDHIHPVGALGVSTFVLVLLFPVVHPWYMLWAIVPLASWANRLFFQLAVVSYSAAFSFFVLPRGLSLPPGTIFSIYAGALIGFCLIAAIGWWILRRPTPFGLH